MIDTTFIDELASKAPTPGGGGASAYCGALAAALSSMVGNLTVGKKAYAAVQEEVEQALSELDELTSKLVALIDEDAKAFAPLAAAYRMSSATAQEAAAKEEALQHALIDACEVPLRIMRACTRVIEIAAMLAEKGSRMALSDVGVSALFAKAALQGASLNVLINCKSMKDRTRAERYLAEVSRLIEAYGERADAVYDEVAKELGR